MKFTSAVSRLFLFSAATTLALLTGCTSAPTISSHPDTAVNYDQYHSFAMLRPTSMAVSRDKDVTPMLIRQTREEAETAFGAKGLTKTSPESADLLVLVHGGVADKLSVNDWGLSYGRFGRGFAGRGANDLTQYREGTLFIDVFDAKTKELVWRGTAVSEVTDKPDPAAVKTTTATVVGRYPN